MYSKNSNLRGYLTSGLVALALGGCSLTGCGKEQGKFYDRQVTATQQGYISEAVVIHVTRERNPDGTLGRAYLPAQPHVDIGGPNTKPHMDSADPQAVIFVCDLSCNPVEDSACKPCRMVTADPKNPLRIRP